MSERRKAAIAVELSGALCMPSEWEVTYFREEMSTVGAATVIQKPLISKPYAYGSWAILLPLRKTVPR